MQLTSTPWWMREQYDKDEPVPGEFLNYAGKFGIATVAVWGEGKTQEGWGLSGPRGSEGFMARYRKGEFNHRKTDHAFKAKGQAFALVMRSLAMVCVDIDGKNGGDVGAKQLGLLPLTLAETSKSGNGYHLFFMAPDTWDEDRGFARFNDHIGIAPGVDIRAVGCVYHYPQQRWNGRKAAMLPDFLADMFDARKQRHTQQAERISKVREAGDEMEILMMQDELVAELGKPIPAGKRNTTLFAIGSQMAEAEVPGWEELLTKRGSTLGLDDDELDKLVNNIGRYTAKTP